MKTAARIKADVVLMDLPHYALIEPRREGEPEEIDEGTAASEEEAAAAAPSRPRGRNVVELETDRLIVESGFYQKLAEVAGYRNWNEAWDTLFETADLGGDAEAFRRELATFCAAARATSSPERIESDGTLARERFMWRTIRNTLEERKVEPALVEKNLYGDSIQAAVLGRLQERLAEDRQHAGRTCGHLVRSIEMDLPQMVAEVEEACGAAIDAEVRFVSLTEALSHLTVLDRYAVFRNLRRDVLAELIVRCFDRACFSIPEVASVPEDQQEEVVDALLSLAEILLHGDDRRLDRALFAEHVRDAAGQSSVPFLRGAFLGMLTEIRQMDPADLAAEVSAYARAAADEMARAGDFIDGIMAVSRTSIMLGADALVAAIDELLRAAEWEVFLTIIPRLRAAFERLHERQCDAMAERVAVRYGLADEGESLTELRTSVGAAALIARIDRQVAEVMQEWDF